ncbi:hypothetical protein [Tateyamaria sp. syn59]|uniref:hypothetical protein n=1 Tax=Tateyamaria sp. syn59 TaxID=2576942 RepID=UPI0011BE4B49|nr:hypothetical protein [Tateyamaria sp. syn59]
MTVEGGPINLGLLGYGDGRSPAYEKGRGSIGFENEIVAEFDSEHGGSVRNRDSSDITVTVTVTVTV